MRSGDLTADLQKILDVPELSQASVAVLIQSLATGETLYERDATKLVVPASTAKVITLAVAAERLGWDHVYETRLVSSAPIVDGTLQGDLIVIGTGDPSLNRHHRGPGRPFHQWATQLAKAGIRRIAGDLVGDDRAFGPDLLGEGWPWDRLADGLVTPVGALQIHENLVWLTLTPGAVAGERAAVELVPANAGVEIVNHATTTAAGGVESIRLHHWPGRSGIEIHGEVPVGTDPLVRATAVMRPTAYFLRGLVAALREGGIEVEGRLHTELAGGDPPPSELRVLAEHRSPPLAELAAVMMKLSRNGYAETLLRTLGPGAGTAASGLRAIDEVLRGWGIAPTSYLLRDGSGVSRLDFVAPAMMVAVLRQLHRDPRHRDAFTRTLSVAGRDGTLKDRMVGTRAEGNVRAKTGTLPTTSGLAGYLDTSDGEPIAFAILVNNFLAPLARINGIIDAAVERVVLCSRG